MWTADLLLSFVIPWSTKHPITVQPELLALVEIRKVPGWIYTWRVIIGHVLMKWLRTSESDWTWILLCIYEKITNVLVVIVTSVKGFAFLYVYIDTEFYISPITYIRKRWSIVFTAIIMYDLHWHSTWLLTRKLVIKISLTWHMWLVFLMSRKMIFQMMNLLYTKAFLICLFPGYITLYCILTIHVVIVINL